MKEKEKRLDKWPTFFVLENPLHKISYLGSGLRKKIISALHFILITKS